MSPYDIFLAQTYGPWIIVLILVLRELIPFLRDRLFPAYISDRDRLLEDRRKLDERTVIAQEIQAKAMQQIAILYGTINDRTELTAAGTQRIELTVTEINTRGRSRERELGLKVNGRKSAKKE